MNIGMSANGQGETYGGGDLVRTEEGVNKFHVSSLRIRVRYDYIIACGCTYIIIY